MSRISVAWLIGLFVAATGLKADTTTAAAAKGRAGNTGLHLGAEGLSIDPEHSTLTLFVYKSGLFSAFADDHIIDVAIAHGTISEEAPLSFAMEVRSAELPVGDPNLSASKRAEVQTRMLGPEVLDADKFPSITFESTTIESAGPERWRVEGQLTIHGQTRTVTFPVNRTNRRYHGTVAIKQRDFGIAPISIAGGTVKVKDEVKIEFDVVARAR